MPNNSRYIGQALFQRIKGNFTYRASYNEDIYYDTYRFIFWCFFCHSLTFGIVDALRTDNNGNITINMGSYLHTLANGVLCGLFSPIVLPVLAFRTMKQIGARNRA